MLAAGLAAAPVAVLAAQADPVPAISAAASAVSAASVVPVDPDPAATTATPAPRRFNPAPHLTSPSFALSSTPSPSRAIPSAFAAQHAEGCTLRVDAARAAGWTDNTPPATGWVPVTLPDVWTTRWPHFDGVVWYRVNWAAGCLAGRPAAAFVDYVNMAGAVYLNDTLIAHDPQLVEPLSRAWNSPRRWLLPAPLLRTDADTLLIRVSGLSAYAPGLGTVVVGPPGVVEHRYGHAHEIRRDLQLYSLAVTSTLGCFFVVLWLMRRRQSVYGWFGLQSIAWWCFQLNQAATSPWPFSRTDGWESAMSIAVVVFSASFAMFTLRFAGRRFPRLEGGLWLLSAAQAAVMLAAPREWIETVRAAIALIPALVFIACCSGFVVFAVRRPRGDRLALSGCMLIFIAACLHDILTFLGVLSDNVYYTSIAAQFEMIGMALVLAWRFVTNLRRIEQFNDELTGAVAEARRELRATLDREHALQVTNARLSERLSLAQDLHDGLGGTLVSSITTLEHAPQDMPPARFLGILKELRDDLRIIIDAASLDHAGTRTLDGFIAPMRHRFARAFEAQDIDCRWQLSGIDALRLPNAVCLDVMRVLQEAVTNALRHSGATRVNIAVAGEPAAGLSLTVTDNGRGFDPDAPSPHGGIGMGSLRARVERLGGVLRIASGVTGTTLTVTVAGIGTGGCTGVEPPSGGASS
ncbi:7TM diverse intracellular signaling domain-containing protein [Burkholderia sp. Ac-20379]|uniref:sensor histidine kinase n=1 Tax=Burkholderia sp. Ac-20379 TaxID=2703900 RepID=UPI001F11E7E9|nr:7TM diverse intracellular signaling domain-containing protein [Burkholderia sp. Ac-20379]